MQTKFIIFAGILSIGLWTACQNNEDVQPINKKIQAETVKCTVNILPAEGETLEDIVHTRLLFTDIATGEKTELTIERGNRANLDLPEGNYDVSMESHILSTRIAASGIASLMEHIGNIRIDRNHCNPEFRLPSRKRSSGLKLLALYFRGGRGYYKDKFFVIYNNGPSSEPISNLAILESAFINAWEYNQLTPDIRSTHFAVGAAYKVPSSATRILDPGDYLVLCDQGITHTRGSQIDLEDPDFWEWYDNHALDFDSPAVPNLVKLFSYSLSVWTPHMVSHKSFALARIPANTPAEFSTPEYYYPYSYLFVHGTYQKVMRDTVRKLPNSMILDVVNVAKLNEFTFNPSSVNDDGYTWLPVGTSCIYSRRKTRGTLSNGAPYFKDTNNSTEDFVQYNNNNLIVNQNFFSYFLNNMN